MGQYRYRCAGRKERKKMKNKMLTANMLKIIAVAAMTLDHITWTLFPGYDQRIVILILHGIGRITMPIMCYFIAEGYYHTRNLKRYLGRLFIFSFISHFAYTFAFGISFIPFKTGIFNQTSVIWAMFWGLFALAAVKSDDGRLKFICNIGGRGGLSGGLEQYCRFNDCIFRNKQGKFCAKNVLDDILGIDIFVCVLYVYRYGLWYFANVCNTGGTAFIFL